MHWVNWFVCEVFTESVAQVNVSFLRVVTEAVDTNMVARSPRCTRIVGAWKSLQVELRGQYSRDRLMALQKYNKNACALEIILLVLITPLPCLVAVVLADVTPLAPPEAGTNANVIFWLRACLIISLYTASFVVQFCEMLPALPMSRRRKFGITGFVSAGTIAFAYLLSLLIGFPVPFLMVLGAPVWMVLLLGSFSVCWGSRVRESSALQAQIVSGLKMFVVQMSMIVIYPFYLYVFISLSSALQGWFSLALIIIKMAIKNGISYNIQSNTDMQPEIVVFNVDVFNALFVSFSMQNTTSKLTVVVIMTVDFIRMVFSLQDVMQSVRELQQIDKQINLLETLVSGHALAPRRSRSTLSRACIIANRRSIDLTSHDPPCSPSNNDGNTEPKRLLAFFSRSGRVFPHKSPDKIDIPIQTSKSQEIREPDLPSYGVAGNAQDNLAALENLYTRKILDLMHLAEITILVEYTEVIVPVVYSIYVAAMSYLPNRIYYSQLVHMDTDKLQNTLANVLLYGLLELISIIVLTLVLQKTMRYSPVHQLAFVLRTQWKMIQSKLILWVVYVVQSSLVHFGADYSFQFAWLKKADVSSSG